jgi:RNA polymerase sigma-B factor
MRFADTDTDTDLAVTLVTTPRHDPSWSWRREHAITAWLPMARRLARRYTRRGEDLDDLTQVAVIGLIKAIDGFEPERGADFTGYAIPTILGELRRHFRDRMWNVRVPRRVQELNIAINKARGELIQTLCRAPTIADIATHLDIGEEEVIEGLEGGYAYRPALLSTPVSADSGAELGDTLGSPDPGFAMTDLQLALGPAMAHLTEREQKIVTLRFYGNLTQSQIGEQVGVSQMHVSRLLAQALAKLRSELGADSR